MNLFAKTFIKVKTIYLESSDSSSMSIEEVKLLRKLLGDMKVRGKDCPKPIQNWY
jgi:hypothetical protein